METGDALPSYTCPFCRVVSYNQKDVESRYCGDCQRFEDELMSLTVAGRMLGVHPATIRGWIKAGKIGAGQKWEWTGRWKPYASEVHRMAAGLPPIRGRNGNESAES